jgi:hypothetical protein
MQQPIQSVVFSISGGEVHRGAVREEEDGADWTTELLHRVVSSRHESKSSFMGFTGRNSRSKYIYVYIYNVSVLNLSHVMLWPYLRSTFETEIPSRNKPNTASFPSAQHQMK